MLPRLLSPQFGLMDDGRSLSIAEGVINGNVDLSWDTQAGRFRPVYWALFTFWYLLADGNPFWYFFNNLILFSATTYILIRLVKNLGGSEPQAWTTGLVYALSTPVIENVYTLSKAENFQVFLIVVAIWLVVLSHRVESRSKKRISLLLAFLSILLACFTKENSLILVPISLIWWGIAYLGRRTQITSSQSSSYITGWIVVASVLSGGIFYLARSIFLTSRVLGVGQYSEFYFDRSQIINGVVRWGGWLLRDFTWMVPLSVLVIIACFIQRRRPRSDLWLYSLVWMGFWMVLYLPWHFAVGYYLLPFTIGNAVLAGVLVNEGLLLLKSSNKARKGLSTIILGLTAMLLLVTQANNLTDASIQLVQDGANARVIEYLANNLPEDSQVIVNIQLANEYIEQMQLMLTDFYDRPDIHLSNFQGEDNLEVNVQSKNIYFLMAELENQPKMTVRMGLDQPSLRVWNSSVQDVISTWKEIYQVDKTQPILTVDFPRLLCTVVYRENYCSSEGGLVNYRLFRYTWLVFTP